MRKIGALVVLLLVVVAGWSALWVYASHAADRQMDAWLQAEATQGRVWTCPNRATGGYPFAITIACSDPTFAGQARGQAVEGSLAAATAEASVLHPNAIALTLRAPFAYKTSDGQTSVQGSWSSLLVTLTGIPHVSAVTLNGTDVAVHGTFGQAGQQGGQAARLDTNFVLAPNPVNPTLAFAITVDGAPVPMIDALLGGTVPLAIALTGRLDRVDIGEARTPEDAMERWRLAGGRIDLDQGRITRGPSKVTASGALSLDALRRPQGRLAAQFIGLEPILRQFGISGNMAAAGSLLTSLFGGGGPQAAPSEPSALALPISFQNGRLGIGPIRTQITLPPLY